MSEALQHYVEDGSRRGPPPSDACTGAAGGAPCGDLVRVSVALEASRVASVSWDAEGCAASRGAAAAVAEAVDGASVLEAARIGPAAVSERLGGLGPSAAHAAELAVDALHRALAAAAGSQGRRLADPPAGRERVLVAMSGGVDSAVAALLEREAGAEVVAVTVKLWQDERNDGERSCCSPEAVRSARALAQSSLGIPHLTLDLQDAFGAGVVQRFLDGHRAGTTPNPCVLCNGTVRLDAMVELADRLGAVGLATGHYARLADDGEGPLLAAPADSAKDQTYMLSAVRPTTLARLRFPLADLVKPQVREIASRAGLAVARRAESQDLCFLAGVGKRAFFERHGALADRAGEIVDTDGRVLGRHRGHHRFTVGQRRGIGIGSERPLYVLAKDPLRNRITVGGRDELATRTVGLRDAVLHRDGGRVDRVRLRYHARPVACMLDGDGDGEVERGGHPRLTVHLAEPVDGAAPGQTACLMEGDAVVGHGTIA